MKRKYGILVGLGTAVLIAGIMGTFAIQQADTESPNVQKIEETASNIVDDANQLEPGFGQVEKEEGAYSP